MKKVEELKKGDIVTKVGRDACEVYVQSVGKKYITVSPYLDDGYTTKFERNSLHYTDGKNTWMTPHLFLGTMKEYTEYLEAERSRSELARELSNKVSRLPMDKLLQIKEIIEKE